MHRYFIHLCYDGKPFHGWQIQPNASSVQETLENAFKTILKKNIAITGCGRTDTGVHAENYFAHFETELPFDKKHLTFKLNSFLPQAIGIKKIFEVEAESHARFDAVARTYRYFIQFEKNPFKVNTSWYLYGVQPDLGIMNSLCEQLIGNKDFGAFEKSGADNTHSMCDVFHAEWYSTQGGIYFEIRANRFLRNMVRAITGTMVDAGLGKITSSDFLNILNSKDRSQAGASVPAEGLFLWSVNYPDKIYLK
ncbi:MAG: tRNA pseudouridine(38-40) synthase TruA [Flavobacteriales bacterium]|nr:tRNA pseudouridine(38-40) synthase TruA [Flavobacteriales bacterium]